MVPCYGFRPLFTKGSLKLLSKNWFIAYPSMNGGINCFVVLIILNALKKLIYYTAVRLSQKILNFAAFRSVRSFVCIQENAKNAGIFHENSLIFTSSSYTILSATNGQQ